MFFKLALSACLVAVALSQQEWGEEKKKMEGGMSEFEKWAMAEKKEQYEKYQKYKEFEMFKAKLTKMHEMEKKKALYEEFLEFKKHKEQKMMSDKKEDKREENDEDDDTVQNEMKDHAEKFESAIKSFHEGNEKMAMMVTKSFLGMCKCQNDMGAELMTMLKKSDSQKSGMEDMFDAEMPDFMGNMTAKAHFLQKLQPEQRQKMMVYGLVKSMCSGAKTFILHAKAFEQKYMSPQSNSNSTAMIN
ncbi:hypothetical protein SNE40_017321 [Patella caerulea]|uniref:Uncharacterized protein n=1 Tax=Patella caerulea TaxID=87958 RepID=A0AAN8PPV5_PATCE